MRGRRPVVLALVVLAGACARTPVESPRAQPARPTATSASPSASMLPRPGCGTPVPRHAWAVALDATGGTRWSVPLSTSSNADAAQAAPVSDADRAYVAEDGTVHALDLTDGRQAWAWQAGKIVYSMWRWHDVLVVLTDQVGNSAHLDGLDASTGRRLWTVRGPTGGWYDRVHDTSDGGLAMVGADGVVQVVDMATGRVRWRHDGARFALLAAVDGLVVRGHSGVVTAYDARTGARRWQLSGMPQQPALRPGPPGLLLVQSDAQGTGIPTALIAVRTATGAVAWRFDVGSPLMFAGAGPGGVLVMPIFTRQRHLQLIDAATGRLRWQVAGGVQPYVTADVSADDLIAIEGGLPDVKPVELVDRATADGHPRWRAPLPFTPLSQTAPVRIGSDYVIVGPPTKPGAPAPVLAVSTTGQRAWQAQAPALVQRTPAVAPGGDTAVLHATDPVSVCAL